VVSLAPPSLVLAGFFVRRLLATPFAELLQLEAVPRVGLALRGDVVPPLARLACERDRRAFVTGHFFSLFVRTLAASSGCELSAVS